MKIVGSLALILSASFTISLSDAKSPEPHHLNRAKTASDLATRAIKRGELEHAKILLMNAFNRDPSNLKYLKEIHAFNHRFESKDGRARAELIELTERALYLIAPEDVEAALVMLKNLKLQQESSKTSSNITHRATLLARFQLSATQESDQEIFDQLEALESLLNDPLSGDLKKTLLVKLQSQRTQLTRYHRLLDLSQELQRYMRLLEKSSPSDSPRAQARSRMISNTLNIMYSEEIESLPQRAKVKLEAVMGDAERTLKAYIKQRSKRSYLQAAERYNTFIVTYNQTIKENKGYQAIVLQGSQLLEALRAIIIKIQNDTSYRQTKDLINQVQRYIQHALEAQSTLYNRWSAERCLQARQLINKEVSLSDAEAITIFYESDLAKIDARYISPEVSSIYHQLIQEILTELPASKAIELQRDLMTSKKRRLDSF